MVNEDPGSSGRPGQLEDLEGCQDPTCSCTTLITEILARVISGLKILEVPEELASWKIWKVARILPASVQR